MRKTFSDSKKKEAAILGPQYDYMDSLKLKGWLWEFIRRSAPYKKQYKKFSSLAARISKSASKEKTLISLVRCTHEIKKLGVQPKEGEPNEWGAPDYCAVNVTNPITGNKECWAIPNPDRMYCQFPIEDPPDIGKPVIKGVPYKFVNLLSSPEQNPSEGNMSLQEFCDMLSPGGDPKEVLFFGISKRARDKDIKEIIIPYIQKMLEMFGERSSVRVSKNTIWKHSLFIYDRKKENPQRSNTELLNLARHAFPDDDELDQKNADECRRYSNNVRHLINGDYIDFLTS